MLCDRLLKIVILPQKKGFIEWINAELELLATDWHLAAAWNRTRLASSLN